ncbi:hypothetical protein [Anabaena azotica]|uniref:Uncharacterized protein n=1 Tax=Anabaena azotica FACHB-119 TaxID=947527 RepID=A0ABR8D1E7_9NOST|nr:hypothetical protein [Anabaena azotica]MBD2501009.1 hypothetical protein [Anabaena azotica FACHB-119]
MRLIEQIQMEVPNGLFYPSYKTIGDVFYLQALKQVALGIAHRIIVLVGSVTPYTLGTVSDGQIPDVVAHRCAPLQIIDVMLW